MKENSGGAGQRRFTVRSGQLDRHQVLVTLETDDAGFGAYLDVRVSD